MEEQVLSEKQFKTIKRTNRLLVALFVISILISIGLANMMARKLLSDYSLYFVEIFLIVFLSYFLLYEKSKNRKRKIAVAALVYASLRMGISVYSLCMLKNAPLYLRGIQIVCILAGALFLFLCLCLMRKISGKPVGIRFLMGIFILYVILAYFQTYTSLYISYLAKDLSSFTEVIVLGIIAAPVQIIILQPQFAIYRALTDDVFYQKFIVKHPEKALEGYRQAGTQLL